ncbi:tRNA (5-methylaminomethyl-2-thiouridine)(34)-methyltransferase MnmD [Nitratireductor sp. XY-223]|uniref:tRNA (5-methylaminomethyl-2-thiouridine)(34)-methyltransferase MnmD n=1 Tax=Nitratireductor sp. XY-223 TaxID=2561926 RepID=UPI0010AA7FB0|nr:tRNA (5-methylaminomethyl-2-thiouridine)(34)-methyltransferase MnmD [Nitratireductor sp. XY-223]
MSRQNDTGGPTGREIEWHAGDMPYSPVFGDHFYSRSDGRAECGHVFLGGNDLPDRWRDSPNFTVAELGFGTGLNFCETWRLWREVQGADGHLLFVSFEKFPLHGDEIARALSAWPELAEFSRRLTEHWPESPPGSVRIDFDDSVALELHVGDALERLSHWEDQADAWFLDGFAPDRNPDMWSKALMEQVFAHTAPGGSFATYSAAGWVRRNLEAAGFAVEKRRGFGGKREMSAGRKTE